MVLRRLSWLLVAAFSLLVALTASRYLQLDPATYFAEQREIYLQRETVLVLHVVGGMLALLLGPWQFVSRLRVRRPRVHRALGYGYVLGVALGAAAGLLLAPTAYGGVVSSLGFAALGACWAGTTLRGVMSARVGRYAEHRRWMVLSFSLSFAAVTLRLWLGAVQGFDAAGLSPVSFATAYPVVAWLCWVPNLAIATWATRDRSATVM
jgi:uncharacterized membrane protein